MMRRSPNHAVAVLLALLVALPSRAAETEPPRAVESVATDALPVVPDDRSAPAEPQAENDAALEKPAPSSESDPGITSAPAASDAASVPPSPQDPVGAALSRRLEALPPGEDDEERRERAALIGFYETRINTPLWTTPKGPTDRATATITEIKNAGSWGLDAGAFPPPAFGGESELTPDAQAEAEVTLSVAVLKYGRHARGGRIIHPAGLLNSNLDRRPQLIDPRAILDGIANAVDTAAYLRGLHPQHPQFEKLRQKYLALRDAKPRKGAPDAKKLLANMEEWRWMWADMGDLYVVANVPEFMLHVVKNGQVIHSERIVAGELDKQTAIFSRRLKHIVLRPKWKVPASIKVKEILPSLLRGGNLWRKYGLEMETKSGEPVNVYKVDWTKADIREYEVIQPPGPKSTLGKVKFSFPSPHTIYMHDTPDKYMFNAAQRTLSHGCLRVRNPMKLAEILLAEDKGWDRALLDDLSQNGPLNNEIAIDGKIPIHITYFTAWVADDGTLKSYRDVYGHEQRITLALDGKWDRIAKGVDHLAPVELTRVAPARLARSKPKTDDSVGALLNSILGGGF